VKLRCHHFLLCLCVSGCSTSAGEVAREDPGNLDVWLDDDSEAPTPDDNPWISSTDDWILVDGSDLEMCGTHRDGTVQCWGPHENGQNDAPDPGHAGWR